MLQVVILPTYTYTRIAYVHVQVVLSVLIPCPYSMALIHPGLFLPPLLIPATLFSIIILMNNWWRALKYKGKTAGRYLVQADRMHVITTQLTVQCSSIQYSVHTLYMYSTYVIRTPHTHWLSLFNKTTPKMARALACSTRGVAGIDVLGNPVCDRARGGYFVACKMQSYKSNKSFKIGIICPLMHLFFSCSAWTYLMSCVIIQLHKLLGKLTIYKLFSLGKFVKQCGTCHSTQPQQTAAKETDTETRLFLMPTYTKEFVVFTKDFVKRGPRKTCRPTRIDDLYMPT